MNLFLHAREIVNPDVVQRVEKDGKDEYNRVTRQGKFRKVLSLTGREHTAMRMLIHGEEKFAPASGDGILITESAFRKFNNVH